MEAVGHMVVTAADAADGPEAEVEDAGVDADATGAADMVAAMAGTAAEAEDTRQRAFADWDGSGPQLSRCGLFLLC